MKILMWLLIVVLALYTIVCFLLYVNQEAIIFYPQKLAPDHTFNFNQRFEEKNITVSDGVILNGILFKTDSAKGLVFYLHGNAGSLDSWGEVAEAYTGLTYDVFMLDYRGYGKSNGKITSQDQFFRDVQTAYDELKKSYPENRIVVLGYSVGTGLAAKLTSTNNPRLLILQAPYYSFVDMMKTNFRYVPTFILKYKFETNIYLKDCNAPVIIFHGQEDEVIPYTSSLRLKAEFENKVTLITLPEEGHNGMTYNADYLKEINRILK